jgi:hypothetical protein
LLHFCTDYTYQLTYVILTHVNFILTYIFRFNFLAEDWKYTSHLPQESRIRKWLKWTPQVNWMTYFSMKIYASKITRATKFWDACLILKTQLLCKSGITKYMYIKFLTLLIGSRYIFHKKQCSSCREIHLWSVGSYECQQPFYSHSEQCVVMVWHTLEQCVFLFDSYVK